MLRFEFPGFSGYSVQYSPYYDNKLALATASNFGLVGNGKLIILEIDNSGRIKEYSSFLTQDCLFDTAWNELHENQVVVAQGDGTLRLFDIQLQKYPIAIYSEHKREVLSCNWDLVGKKHFASSSWDGSVKIWSPERKQSVRTFVVETNDYNPNEENRHTNVGISNQPSHSKISKNKNCVYEVQYSPHDANILVCSSGKSYVTMFDIRQALPIKRFRAHQGLETLTCDFNKYRPFVLASAGADNAIRIWDLRMADIITCLNEISGAHKLAIRKVAWSPHHSNLLLSTSYDMTCSVWQDAGINGTVHTGRTNSTLTDNGCKFRFDKHTEFVFGADWSLWGKPGYVASTGWDGNVFIYNIFSPNR